MRHETVRKYSPDEARDQSGKWTTGGGGSAKPAPKTGDRSRAITGYHGTTKEVVADILKEGLIPHKSPGGDAWADAHHAGQDFHTSEREHSVFFAANKSDAAMFANLAAKERHQTAAMLELHIPKAEAAKHMHADENESPDQVRNRGGSSFARYEGVIKPEWIKAVAMPEIDPGGVGIKGPDHKWQALAKAADDDVEVL